MNLQHYENLIADNAQRVLFDHFNFTTYYFLWQVDVSDCMYLYNRNVFVLVYSTFLRSM